ncbi:MAG: zinc ribbon domain-containing protein [Planctomycetes bacterium]|nr:zinc ribbon domain-containing protein [Planctomycetota bacterium]
MPTYDYECDACGYQFEKFQSITAQPIRKCPVCGKLKIRRLIGAGSGIIFKGSGFYQTDYRSDSYRKAADKDKTAAGSANSDSSSDGGGSKKSDGKAAKPGSSVAED